MNMTDILPILERGERQDVEFKREFQKSTRDIAKEIAALANSGGGLLLIGVDDNGSAYELTDLDKAELRLAGIAGTCLLRGNIKLHINIEKVWTKGKENKGILVATIPPSEPWPCWTNNRIYIRIGTTSVDQTAENLQLSSGPIRGGQRCVTVLISHDRNDKEHTASAESYRTALAANGFDAWRYGMDYQLSTLGDEIEKRHFFVPHFAQASCVPDIVRHEINVARQTQRRNRGYRPLIVPVAPPKGNGTFVSPDQAQVTRREKARSVKLPLLDTVGRPIIDTEERLIECLKPRLYISREDGFDDEDLFHELRVFDLYKSVFPANERDEPADIIRWVLEEDRGTTISVDLGEGVRFKYNLDSRFFILSLVDVAVGLAFLTYDAATRLVYGNYIAVQESWRNGGMAKYFVEQIRMAIERLFPKYEGVVFEVEKFDTEMIEQLLRECEEIGSPERRRRRLKLLNNQERDAIRRLRRIHWYQSMGFEFFVDKNDGKPINCIAPCVRPADSLRPAPDENEWERKWQENEEEYWLMWWSPQKSRPGLETDVSQPWRSAVRCVYGEVLAKSLADEYKESFGLRYWRYANRIIDDLVRRTEGMSVATGKIERRGRDNLYQRWRSISAPCGVTIPI